MIEKIIIQILLDLDLTTNGSFEMSSTEYKSYWSETFWRVTGTDRDNYDQVDKIGFSSIQKS